MRTRTDNQFLIDNDAALAELFRNPERGEDQEHIVAEVPHILHQLGEFSFAEISQSALRLCLPAAGTA
jgi:hypothetical protein